MARKSYVQINGVLIDKEDTEALRKASGDARQYATIMPDLPDFVSPIDGKTYSGRAGLREHCKVHDVVPNEDLKGLPYLASNSDQRSESQRRRDNAARKGQIIHLVNKHYG